MFHCTLVTFTFPVFFTPEIISVALRPPSFKGEPDSQDKIEGSNQEEEKTKTGDLRISLQAVEVSDCVISVLGPMC